MEATEYIAGIRVGKWMLQTKVASYIGCVRKDEHADGGRVLEETEVVWRRRRAAVPRTHRSGGVGNCHGDSVDSLYADGDGPQSWYSA